MERVAPTDGRSIRDVMRELGVSAPTVYKLIRRGELRVWRHPLYLPGGRVKVFGDDVERLRRLLAEVP